MGEGGLVRMRKYASTFQSTFLETHIGYGGGGVTFSRSDQKGALFTRLRNSDPVSGLGLKSRVRGQYELYRCHPSGGLQPALGSVL